MSEPESPFEAAFDARAERKRRLAWGALGAVAVLALGVTVAGALMPDREPSPSEAPPTSEISSTKARAASGNGEAASATGGEAASATSGEAVEGTNAKAASGTTVAAATQPTNATALASAEPLLPPAPGSPPAESPAEPPAQEPRSEKVRLVFTTVPAARATVSWGKHRLGTIAPRAPLVVERPRDSGPLDVVIRSPGFLPVHTRAYTFDNALIDVRLTPVDKKDTLFGYRAPLPPPDAGVAPPP